ncbi:hypothetical protein BGX27_003362, partial [Mortierella sp. AM989]
MSVNTTSLFDSIIPGKVSSEVGSDESDDGLPMLGMDHDSASDSEGSEGSEGDNYDDEIGDYSSDMSNSEPETEDDIVHEVTETTPTDPVDITTAPPELDHSANNRADEITTEILSSQLDDYDWIKSTVDDDTIKSIVARSRTHGYDYLPRVFYIDKQDFDVWLEQDGHDHFFEWIRRKHRDNHPGQSAPSDFSYFEVYLCHREGHPRIGQCRPQDPTKEPREIKKRKVYKPSPK